MQREEIARLIAERLQVEAEKLRAEFHLPRLVPTRFVAIDDVLPKLLAWEVFERFPAVEQMRLLSTFRERKYTSKALDKMDLLISDMTFAFQTQEVIQQVESITGVRDIVGDPHLYAGGISTMLERHFLNPHIDNSHDAARHLYRVLNLLYYVTPNWRAENGGNLELWDSRVKEGMEIPSLFNRLVIMETHERSWHSVNRVKVAGRRCCISNYYFSPHPPGDKEHFHITRFTARPEERLRRVVSLADNVMRSMVRKAFKQGIGRADVYQGKG